MTASMLSSLMLFNGDTMYPSSGMMTALKDTLADDRAKPAGKQLVMLRGLRHHLFRSDLEHVCRTDLH